MKTFVAVIVPNQLPLLAKIVGEAVSDKIIGNGNDPRALVRLELTVPEIRDYLNKIDTYPVKSGEEQGDIAELYLDIDVAFQAYEDSLGLRD